MAVICIGLVQMAIITTNTRICSYTDIWIVYRMKNDDTMSSMKLKMYDG